MVKKKKLKNDHGLLRQSDGYNTASNAGAGAQLRSRGPSSTVQKKKKKTKKTYDHETHLRQGLTFQIIFHIQIIIRMEWRIASKSEL